MAIENTVSNDFDPRSSIVKSVFDCRLPGVVITVCLLPDLSNVSATLSYIHVYISAIKVEVFSLSDPIVIRV